MLTMKDETLYSNGDITVKQKGDVRILCHGLVQSAGNGTDELLLPYTRGIVVATQYAAKLERVLMIGLGGGSIARHLRHHNPELVIDCVEVDPAILEVAQNYFGLEQDDMLQVCVADGREFIELTKELYDVIILDAYDAEGIPPHMATSGFLRLARNRLTPGGVVVGNLLKGACCETMLRAYGRVFGSVRAITGDWPTLVVIGKGARKC